jgi:hypothetical protein
MRGGTVSVRRPHHSETRQRHETQALEEEPPEIELDTVDRALLPRRGVGRGRPLLIRGDRVGFSKGRGLNSARLARRPPQPENRQAQQHPVHDEHGEASPLEPRQQTPDHQIGGDRRDRETHQHRRQ